MTFQIQEADVYSCYILVTELLGCHCGHHLFMWTILIIEIHNFLCPPCNNVLRKPASAGHNCSDNLQAFAATNIIKNIIKGNHKFQFS